MTVIDARGMRCPWPALRLAKALRGDAGDVEILADDPVAPGELVAVAAAHGRDLTTIGEHRFRAVRRRDINALFTAIG